MAKFEFDPDELQLTVNNAHEIVLRPDGEEALVRFYQFKDQLDLCESIIKEKLGEAMVEMNPNQKSVISDHLKITRKTAYESGKKYRFEGDYDEQYANRTERVYLNPNTAAISTLR